MGTELDDAGISVQLYDEFDKPKGSPIHGTFTLIAGQPREKIVGTGTLTPEETLEPGSDDWLTLVVVADSQERFDAIVNSTKVKPLTKSLTSHSSWRVLVELHVGNRHATFSNCVTVASGPILSLEPGKVRIKVAHVKVVPDPKRMIATSRLFAEFKGGKCARDDG